MTNSLKQQSYFRTLVFTVMAALVSVMLMVLVFFVPQTRDYLALIITIQIGLFLIIAYCIRSVMNKEKDFDNMSNPDNYVVKFDSCPDYFNRKLDAVSKRFYCSNEYVVPHPYDPSRQVIAKMMLHDPTNVAIQFPDNHSNEYMNTQGAVASKPLPSEKFYIDVLYDKSLKTIADKCALVDESSVREVPNDPIENRKEYKQLPWTSVRSRCNGLFSKYL